MRMHLEAYRRRPDIRGIVHAHPPTVVAASIAGLDLAQCLIPEVIVMLGVIPVAVSVMSPVAARCVAPVV